MREHLDDLHDSTGAAAELAVVTFTTPEFAVRYHEHHALPFPLLVDPTRDAYRAYGLARGSVGRVWGWRAAARYLAIIARSGVGDLRPPTEDTLQLGGDFVIDREGRLAWGFWGAGPDDRPAIGDLVAAVAAIS